ncbi:hypothetical protein JAAARDRAFT_130834 [Jaapia argillacea MUCL 33604]|uniref:Major facilitator superfamily (MFS) profile domain-containing protein n=1 Tax=Jaapia argillacea MUCL 33604 TaxID=933084 RepID=A0A067PSB6_9AGAM|nr:hypothetical protein JAAARDRAFT_130834 [Jaapia argillacea MUCL 33604]
MELFRETVAGTVLHFFSRGRIAPYPEERPDFEVPPQFFLEKTSDLDVADTVPPSRDPITSRSSISSESTRTRVGPSQGSRDLTKKATETVITTAVDEKRQPDHLDQPDEPPQHEHTAHPGSLKEAEGGFDPNLVDWYGPDDAENPRNWGIFKKAFVTSQLCLLTFSIYIGSSIYTAGIPSIVREFGVSDTAAILGLTLFVVGYGIGPMFLAPLSEIPAFGRNAIYIITLALFVILQVPTALAHNLGALLPLRFLAGFVGSPVLATGGASLADIYIPSKRAYAIGIWGIAAVCGPVLGPLVGGFAAQAHGWRWTIWILLWLSGSSLVILIFTLPETSASHILVKRARRLRKLTGNPNLRSAGEIEQAHMTAKEVAMMTLIRPFVLSVMEPVVFFLNLYIALVYGLLYLWFEAFPLVFVDIYGFNLGEQGLAFMGIFVGVLLSYFLFCLYCYFVLEKQFEDGGNYIVPEKRLPIACAGAFMIPICLFWFGWTSQASIHWIVPIIGSGFFGLGTFWLFQAVLNYLGDAYPRYAASVLAGNDFFRSSFGAAFPLFANAMYKNLGGGGGVAWGSSLIGFISILMIPIPFVLYKYGGRIRKLSKYAD